MSLFEDVVADAVGSGGADGFFLLSVGHHGGGALFEELRVISFFFCNGFAHEVCDGGLGGACHVSFNEVELEGFLFFIGEAELFEYVFVGGFRAGAFITEGAKDEVHADVCSPELGVLHEFCKLFPVLAFLAFGNEARSLQGFLADGIYGFFHSLGDDTFCDVGRVVGFGRDGDASGYRAADGGIGEFT